ncbi:hypothetical protein TRIATDRAFT_242992 [Trichoderma atroviride IMI 206040]|uniref:F-box domain-containing protein n=2 Tax=Hypocrea atroviridis TaxID=63577 RepID=G9NVI1_HYPAI|nr:uncharacterized protein TRIATDRAFT_242992 [Trichoderma atroviride IMI 206040]EHK45001.1 hypothetical protein TRIATDRAFT_242992 [Trichoderma atroviride IMI 206040]
MVQVHGVPSLSQSGNDTLEAGSGRSENKVVSREEHAQRARELMIKRGMMRAPRRGWSLTEYQAQNDGPHHFHAAMPTTIDRIPEHAAVPASPAPQQPIQEQPVQKQPVQLPQRPKLPPPRRSYSVTDKEPEPANQPRPSARLTLLDLPSELHYAIFDFLDPIDGACLGLTHSKLYDIHRRKNGTVPLSSRYSGPNDIEWAWRGAGPLVHPHSNISNTENDLERLRVKGQVYCRKCGISRCELHRHLKDWFGKDAEYCEIKEMYGPPARSNAKGYCFMRSPKNPHWCGRHGAKTTAS